MAVGNDTSNGTTTRKDTRMAPVHLFSHGSTMMLGEDSASARYWKKCGDEALANGVEHIIMMVSIVPTYVPLLTTFSRSRRHPQPLNETTHSLTHSCPHCSLTHLLIHQHTHTHTPYSH